MLLVFHELDAGAHALDTWNSAIKIGPWRASIFIWFYLYLLYNFHCWGLLVLHELEAGAHTLDTWGSALQIWPWKASNFIRFYLHLLYLFSLLGAAGAPWIWCWGQYTACMRLCPAYWALGLGLQRTWASSPELFHPKSRKRVHNFQTIKSKFYCKLYTSPPGGGPSDRRKKMQGPQMCFLK